MALPTEAVSWVAHRRLHSLQARRACPDAAWRLPTRMCVLADAIASGKAREGGGHRTGRRRQGLCTLMHEFTAPC
jgi:hypothetical protein